jgi:hypothetical protein
MHMNLSLLLLLLLLSFTMERNPAQLTTVQNGVNFNYCEGPNGEEAKWQCTVPGCKARYATKKSASRHVKLNHPELKAMAEANQYALDNLDAHGQHTVHGCSGHLQTDAPAEQTARSLGGAEPVLGTGATEHMEEEGMPYRSASEDYPAGGTWVSLHKKTRPS